MTRNQFTAVLIGIILILFFALGLVYRSGLKWKDEAVRSSVNVASLTAEKGRTAIVQTLKESELKNRYGKIIDSLEYRLNRVDGITTVRIKKEVRTVHTWRDSIVHDTLRLGRVVQSVDSCIALNIFDRGDTVEVSGNITIKADVIYHRGKRIAKWWKIWDWSRYPMVTVHSNCGSVQVESVKVSK